MAALDSPSLIVRTAFVDRKSIAERLRNLSASGAHPAVGLQQIKSYDDDDDVELNVLGCRVHIIIRDKLTNGSMLLYVHRNHKAH